MAVPGYQEFMLPLLRIAGDGEEHTSISCVERLADEFNLSPEDRRELLPSSRQTRLLNRLSWATIYLHRAGLLDRPARGRYKITDEGRQVLKSPPPRIDATFLSRYAGFIEFQSSRPDKDGSTGDPPALVPDATTKESPEEVLANSYKRLRHALAIELLEKVSSASPQFFERLVVDLLVAMGYGGSRSEANAAVVGGSGDDGIDGIIKEDRLGLDAVYIQAKRWQQPIGRPTVQAFAGSLEGHRARKGVLITTSRFTTDAEQYVARIEKRIVLIDGEQLAQLMIDFGVGVTDVDTYVVKKVDSDYFSEE